MATEFICFFLLETTTLLLNAELSSQTHPIFWLVLPLSIKIYLKPLSAQGNKGGELIPYGHKHFCGKLTDEKKSTNSENLQAHTVPWNKTNNGWRCDISKDPTNLITITPQTN